MAFESAKCGSWSKRDSFVPRTKGSERFVRPRDPEILGAVYEPVGDEQEDDANAESGFSHELHTITQGLYPL